MAKQTPFFKFDSAAWLGGSIQFTDLQSKGLFIDLCALYWESQKPIKIDTKFKVRIRCDEGTLSDLLGTLSDLDIIEQSEHGITVPFLDSLMSERNDWLEKCSKAGKKAHIVKGTSSNKKEERRKKSVERREEKEDIREDIKDDLTSEVDTQSTKKVEPLYHQYFEIFQSIKPFNVARVHTEIISRFREAAQSVPEIQILEAAKDYKQHCYHAEQPIDFRKSAKNFLSEKQYKVDWLMQHKINKRGDSPPELWDLWLARNNKYPNFEWST